MVENEDMSNGSDKNHGQCKINMPLTCYFLKTCFIIWLKQYTFFYLFIYLFIYFIASKTHRKETKITHNKESNKKKKVTNKVTKKNK